VASGTTPDSRPLGQRRPLNDAALWLPPPEVWAAVAGRRERLPPDF